MAVLSASTPERFTPSGYDNQETAPVYLIKPATKRERTEFTTELVRLGVTMPSDAEVYSAVRNGITDMIDESEQAQLLDIVDRLQGRVTLNNEEQKQYDLLLRTLRRYSYRPVTELEADKVNWYAQAPRIAARMLLVGWENVEPAFETRAGRVTDAALDKISDKDINQIGFQAIIMMHVSREAEKNSGSPSQ